MQELLKSAIFLKQQLKSDEAKRRPNAASQNSSVYKRLSGRIRRNVQTFINKLQYLLLCLLMHFISAHIQTTLDFPDLDLSSAIRETTSRVENMMSTTRNGSTTTVASSSRASSSSNVSQSSEVMQRSHTTLH